MNFPRHIIKSQQFDRPMLEQLFDRTEKMIPLARSSTNILAGQLMAALFYEPSTRTRFSFEAAMLRLGGKVISTENAREFSSAAKGETLEDTVRVVAGYADVIVLRHYESGAAERAAAVSSKPVINAGDGPGQHPTQALLDLYTIQKELGWIDGLKIAMVGDLANGRTVRSLCYLLTRFKVKKIWLVAPPIVRMKDDIKKHLTDSEVDFEEEADLRKVVREAHVIYMTRIQKERFGDRAGDYESARGQYVIDGSILEIMPEKSIIMHPMPRMDEIKPEVDDDPRAAYFRQAKNGLYVRMALLDLVLNG